MTVRGGTKVPIGFVDVVDLDDVRSGAEPRQFTSTGNQHD
jgi:hypothetical protein